MIADFRAGAIRCVCLPSVVGQEAAAPQPMRIIVLLGVGAAASVLSQALMFSLLPLAGRMLAPVPGLVPLPFLGLFVGAVAATFPASILTDAFGRRAAFALGASLGIAGGLVVAWGLGAAAFWPLVVGAFWLGTANGFALQYRHAAAAGGNADAARAAALVIGAGALIGIVAPTLAGLAESRLTPFVGAGSAIVAALAHVVALAAALLLPASRDERAAVAGRIRLADWLPPTGMAAAAWFAMMAVMAFAPIGLSGCGIGFSMTVGVVAWHLVAMYAPALALAVTVERVGTGAVAAAGLALATTATVALGLSPAESTIVFALVAVGAGWSLATSAAVLALHRQKAGRVAVAAHDACVLLAGIAGAMLAGQIF